MLNDDGHHQRFQPLYSGLVYDVMRHDLKLSRPFVLDGAIKPLWLDAGSTVVFGHAFTCRGQKILNDEDIDDWVRLRMFQDFTSGCIQVIDTDRDNTCAHFGDVSGRIARKFGCSAAIVDGNVRDARLLTADRFPVFCRGVQPIDAFGRWQIVEYQSEVRVSGIDGAVVVRPGDYIFGDPDGVLVIPFERVVDVAELAEGRLALENRIRNQLDEYADIEKLHNDIGRW